MRTVFVHAGAADNRMWDELLPGLDDAIQPELHELRGFGQTPIGSGPVAYVEDLEARIGDEPCALVGASFGGLLCMAAAARNPELVTALVLFDALLLDHDFSPELLAIFAEEERLVAAGELDAAADLNVRSWAAHAPPPAQRLVFEMQRNAFELQRATPADGVLPELIDLGAIRAPTLVAWGDLDHADFVAISQRLGRDIPGAETAVIEGSGHLPALERPEAASRLLNRFLQARTTI